MDKTLWLTFLGHPVYGISGLTCNISETLHDRPICSICNETT